VTPSPHSDPDHALVDAVRAALAAAADPVAAEPMQRYMKSAMPYYGVRLPEVRRLGRAVFTARRLPDRSTWEATVRAMFDGATHREERYAALALVAHRYYRPYTDVESLRLYEHLIRTGAWWDLVDETSHRVGDVLRSYRGEVSGVIRRWARSDSLWIRRSSIICQVGHKAETDLDLLRDAIEPNIADRDFFIRKAIGWALRDVAYVEPDWVRTFVNTHGGLAPLSKREALKHLTP
jgi:3-methyladenine DNA glycosylase AlkD